MTFDFAIIVDYAPLFAHGFLVTIGISAGAFAVGLAMGLVVALLKISEVTVLRWFAQAYIELFRNIPFLVQVFLLYYMLPFYGIRFPALVVGILSLGLYVSAYFAEIIRAAILSVPGGQMTSALACGMSRGQALRHVIFPQVLGVMIPPLTSQTMSMVKETALLSSITVNDLTMSALRVQGITFSPFEVFTVVAVLYWGFTALVAALAGLLERRLQPFRYRRATATITTGAAGAADAPLVPVVATNGWGIR